MKLRVFTIVTAAALTFVSLFGMTAVAAESSLSGVELSGFFDATAHYQQSADDQADFGLGQAEIDLESQVSRTASAFVAIAYDNDDRNFGLSRAEINLSLYNNQSGSISSVNLVAGQFYVPFGIDYNVYNSKDRKLISAPLVVEATHHLWTDQGIQFQAEHKYGNFVGYAVNGFKSSAQVIDEVTTLVTGTLAYDEIDTSPSSAYGARLGLTPTENLEIGGSYAFGVNASNKQEMYLFGADLQFTHNSISIKGEYISHAVNRTINEEINDGYYAQVSYSKDRWTVTNRYGSIRPDQGEWFYRNTAGVGYQVTDGVEARVESSFHDDTDKNATTLQMVVGF